MPTGRREEREAGGFVRTFASARRARVRLVLMAPHSEAGLTTPDLVPARFITCRRSGRAVPKVGHPNYKPSTHSSNLLLETCAYHACMDREILFMPTIDVLARARTLSAHRVRAVTTSRK